MRKNLHVILFFAFFVCQKPQAQLTAKENPIPRQVQQISSVQDTPKKIKALSIGDHVPDFQLNLLNYSSPVTNLSSFKGKLIILDFWASWCYSCLHAIPKLNKLQKSFGDKLQFVFVNSLETTGDGKETVIQVIKKYSVDEPISFPVSFNDSVANKLFPHYSLPHYVWITPNGEVKAITDAKDVTAENINAILGNENVELSLAVKIDYFPDKLMDLGVGDNQPVVDDNLAYYSIFKKGKIERLASINIRRDVPGNDHRMTSFRGISLRNVSLLEMFETATKYSKKVLNGNFLKRLILNVKDSSKFFFDPSRISRKEWEKENFYTYDLVIPEGKTIDIDQYIWQDLNRYSGYTAHIESRSIRCLVLTETGSAKVDPGINGFNTFTSYKDGMCHLSDASTEALTNVLDKSLLIKIPVINQTKKQLRFDISFDYDHFDLNKFQKQLQPLGMELKESFQQINVLVITDNRINK